ncbi:hypothetical protein [Methylocella sp.]|uniref:hypothetical protein n=1 Tax=Methylocella sp. TaxID=1978226 RepID=UPI0035AF0ADB
MPEPVKFLLRHALIGIAIGLFVVLIIVVEDVAHLYTLIASSADRWLWLFLLAASFGLTFGSLQMGMAVMLMPRDEED